MRIHPSALILVAGLLVSGCRAQGSNSADSTSTMGGQTTASVNPSPTADPGSTVPDPKVMVKNQADSIIASYVASITGQMPEVTSKVSVEDLTACVKSRAHQMIDAAIRPEGQLQAEFMSNLMSQIQSGIFSLVGGCSDSTG